jgi:hypothetical protein
MAKPINYLISTPEGLSVVNEAFFDDINDRIAALTLAKDCFSTIHDTMKFDAINGSESYIGPMKVTRSLDRTIKLLDKKFPFLQKELQKLKYNGQRLYIA